jgi:hypothetical protein
MLGEDPSFDCQVLPEFESTGIGMEALDWAKNFLVQLRESKSRRWSGHLTAGARLDDPSQITFLEQQGFQRGAYVEVNVLRTLREPITEAALPSGYTVRAVANGDVSKRANAQRIVWQPWSVGKISDKDYARLMNMPAYARELDVVAVTPKGDLAAYVNGWLDPLNRIGDLDQSVRCPNTGVRV